MDSGGKAVSCTANGWQSRGIGHCQSVWVTPALPARDAPGRGPAGAPDARGVRVVQPRRGRQGRVPSRTGRSGALARSGVPPSRRFDMRFIRTHRLAAATLVALLCAGSASEAAPLAAADGPQSDMPAPPGPPGPPPPRDPRFGAALDACAAEQGLPPPPRPGTRPDGPPPEGKRPDHAKFEACMTAQGFKRPPHPPGDHRGPPGPPPEDDADGGGGDAG